MPVTEQQMRVACEEVLAGRAAHPDLTLADYIRDIPGLAALEGLPSGSTVLVRGDLDCKPGATIGDGDIRLRSMVDTLQFGRTAAGSRWSSGTSAASRKVRSTRWPSDLANCSSAMCRS